MSIDNIHQLLAWKPPYMGNAFIGGGILLPETRMIVFGSAGSWKSNLAIHTTFAIAEGLPWFGFKTRKAVVLKVQAELPKYMDRERIEAYALAVRSKPDHAFFKTVDERVKIDTTWGAQTLSRYIEEVKLRDPDLPLVLLLDPLKDLMAGHISEEYDVRKFQDNLNAILRKYNVSVIIFHHPRKRHTEQEHGGFIDSGGEESLGSIHWFNWCDTMLRTIILNPYSGSDLIEYRWEKHRNAKRFLKSFTVQWDRNTLLPSVVEEELEEPSVRSLVE